MASHKFIFAREDEIIRQSTNLKITLSAYDMELRRNEDNRPDMENRDCWGTLYINAKVLQVRLNALLKSMDKEFKENLFEDR